MSLVVGVHGIGQQREGAKTLESVWGPAMQSGVQLAGGKLPEDALTCAFYGDLFRPPGKKSVATPRYGPGDVSDEWELEFLEALWRAAAETEPENVTAPDAQTKVRTAKSVQRALNALSHSKFFSAVAEHAMIADLKQVKAYLHDDKTRQACRARVERTVTPDTRVIIGHSLGSVIAYEALCANPDWNIGGLVTLGSPLGIANLVFNRLLPKPENGQGAAPGGARTWGNVADAGDVVALVKELKPLFAGVTTDLLVDNGAKAHFIKPYLTARETGRVILDGLGA